MGKALADRYASARAVFDEVDAALGQHLSRLMFDGPETELTLTANAQPALMAVSLAALRALKSEAGIELERHVAFVAGHSLGEYSALAAAGALSVADAARLLRLRGTAMQDAVGPNAGAMAALIGADAATGEAIATEAAQGEVCEVANDNGGSQVVLSGAAAAVRRAVDLAKARGIKRAVMLAVSAPFHCAMMQPAADAMKRALGAVEIKVPCVPLISNTTARPVTAAADIRRGLVDQVCGTVRWRESVEWLAGSGVDRFVEVGAGKVLSGLTRRIAPGASAASVGLPDDIAAYATA